MQALKTLLEELKEVLHLSRWGNVLFIAALHLSSYFFIQYFDEARASFIAPLLFPLIISTLCIASAGYLINDYFDYNIDKINKPSRVDHVRKLGKRNLIKWHSILTFIGLLLASYSALEVGKLRLVFLQLVCALALFLYSFVLKKQFLMGNIVIGLLSVVNLVLIPAYAYHTMVFPLLYKIMPLSLSHILILLSAFAFLLTLIREIIKDTEDIKGDILNDCKTLPIVMGISKTKVFLEVLLISSFVAYLYFFLPLLTQSTLLGHGIYLIFQSILLYIMFSLPRAYLSQDFSRLSNVVKLAMVLGLISSFFLLPYV